MNISNFKGFLGQLHLHNICLLNNIKNYHISVNITISGDIKIKGYEII